MKESELKKILNSSVEDLSKFILDEEAKLEDASRQKLIAFLKATDFSAKKYEILSASDEIQVRAVLLGLVYGQIDPYISQVEPIIDGYKEKFKKTCLVLGISDEFVFPISKYNREISDFFDE